MSRNKVVRRISFGVVGIVFVAGLVALLLFGPKGPEVDVARVTQGRFVRYVEEDGRSRVRARYVISSPVGGTMERSSLRVGDVVTRGDVVAVVRRMPSPLLDARTERELQARLGAAQAALASARSTEARADAARAHADDELVRARALLRSGSVAARDLEHAELEAASARREREAAGFASHLAEHELEMARAALTRDDAGAPDMLLSIRAPADGRVLRLYAESEAVVGPATPLLEIGDPSAAEIVVDLLSTDAIRVEPGIDAEISGFGSGTTLRGRVRLVEPTATVRLSALGVEERRVDVVVDPLERDPSWARVGDGYRVDVRIPVERIENTLRVPTSALFRVGETWCAFVLEGERVRRVDVVVASYGPLESAVRSGLRVGASVVREPPEDLADGTKVTVRRASR